MTKIDKTKGSFIFNILYLNIANPGNDLVKMTFTSELIRRCTMIL